MCKEIVERNKLGETNYFIGKLYDWNLEIDLPINEEFATDIFYDEGSGNVHYFPKDLNLAKECSGNNKELWDLLHKSIEDLIVENGYDWELQTEGSGGYASKISKYAGGVNEDLYKYNRLGLFRYISVKIKDKNKVKRTYELIFTTFYKEEDKINCILNRAQFLAASGNGLGKSIYKYPDSLEFKSFTPEYRSQKFESHYYSPRLDTNMVKPLSKVVLIQYVEELVKLFEEFIKINENKEKP